MSNLAYETCMKCVWLIIDKKPCPYLKSKFCTFYIKYNNTGRIGSKELKAVKKSLSDLI